MSNGYIDGFAIDAGEYKRVITLKDGVYYIDCFKGTYDETVDAIRKKYEDNAADEYISKLEDAVSMEWLTDDIHQQLSTHNDWWVRVAVAQYSDRFHPQLKDDKHWRVQRIVNNYTRSKPWE